MKPDQLQLLMSLQEQVRALTEWKTQKESQQISMPIDTSSQAILDKDHLVFKKSVSGAPSSLTGSIVVEINGNDVTIPTI